MVIIRGKTLGSALIFTGPLVVILIGVPEITNTSSNSEELSTDFKNAMDSYENYIDEYIAFMKKYSKNPTDTSLLTQYASMLTKYQQAVKDFENWNTKNLNKAEQKYYVEVQTRVTKKLADASIDMQ